MVRKLIKHELLSTIRIAVIPAIIMVLLAVLARIMIATSLENIFVTIIIFMFYIFSVFVTLFIGYWFGISSFYQSLFTGTGYLTLSLPVTPDQLIWSKLLSAITVMFASAIICVLSACIFFIGLPPEFLDALAEQFAILGEAIRYAFEAEPLLVFEAILLVIVGIPETFLVFYAVMCVGQLFTIKNRKGITILMYFGLIFVWNIISSTIIQSILNMTTEVSIHLTMWLRIIFVIGVDVGCYFLVRHIIKNRINLLA